MSFSAGCTGTYHLPLSLSERWRCTCILTPAQSTGTCHLPLTLSERWRRILTSAPSRDRSSRLRAVRPESRPWLGPLSALIQEMCVYWRFVHVNSLFWTKGVWAVTKYIILCRTKSLSWCTCILFLASACTVYYRAFRILLHCFPVFDLLLPHKRVAWVLITNTIERYILVSNWVETICQSTAIIGFWWDYTGKQQLSDLLSLCNPFKVC